VIPVRSYDPFMALVAVGRAVSAHQREASAPVPLPGAVTQTGTPPEVLVVVVGESLTRHHMGLYGYQRPTTPRLGGLAAAGELVVFRDVVASHADTLQSLRDAFSLTGDGAAAPSATIFQALGGPFDTFWISNQPLFPLFGERVATDEGLLAATVEHRTWLNTDWRLPWHEPAAKFDENVIVPLVDAVGRRSGPAAVFIHLTGSHVAYAQRFPPAFAQFSGDVAGHSRSESAVINAYDNSVLYNDFVVAGLIDRVKALNRDAAVVYFADHGEEVYDFRDFEGHSSVAPSRYAADVPLVVWMSERYRAQRPQLVADVMSAQARPVQLRDLAAAIARLADIRFEPWRNARDPLSVAYAPPRPTVSGVPYDDLPGF
jgi:heptose-I-phosphate ethanolaminephosphotransferase